MFTSLQKTSFPHLLQQAPKPNHIVVPNNSLSQFHRHCALSFEDICQKKPFNTSMVWFLSTPKYAQSMCEIEANNAKLAETLFNPCIVKSESIVSLFVLGLRQIPPDQMSIDQKSILRCCTLVRSAKSKLKLSSPSSAASSRTRNRSNSKLTNT